MNDETQSIIERPLDRRAVIIWCAALAAAIPVSRHLLSSSSEPGYGTDPRLDQYDAPWERILSEEQRQAMGVLCDHILPAEGAKPSASSLHIHELIDEWISAPYPEQFADRTVILRGLEWVDAEARAQGGKSLPDLDLQARNAVFLAWTGERPSLTPPPQNFYAKVRRLTVGGYYTTEVGFSEIGYIGNQALGSFPPVSQETMELLESRMASLGI